MLAIYCRLTISGGRQIWKNDFPPLWPTTWDELLRLAADLQSKGIDPFALGAKECWLMQFWFSLAARITRPIAQLTRSAEEISSGNLDTTAAISSSDEIGGLGRIFNQMTARLRGSFAEILSYRDHLEEQVATRTEALSREIAQRREVEQALRVSEEHLRMIIEQAPLGIIVWDTNFSLVQWNPMAELIEDSATFVLSGRFRNQRHPRQTLRAGATGHRHQPRPPIGNELS